MENMTKGAQMSIDLLISANPNTKLTIIHGDLDIPGFAGILSLSPTGPSFPNSFIPKLPGGMAIDWWNTPQDKSEIYIVFGTKLQIDSYFRSLFDDELEFLLVEYFSQNIVQDNIAAKMHNVIALKFPDLAHRIERTPSPIFKYDVSFNEEDKVQRNPPNYIVAYLNEKPKRLKGGTGRRSQVAHLI